MKVSKYYNLSKSQILDRIVESIHSDILDLENFNYQLKIDYTDGIKIELFKIEEQHETK